MSDNITRGSCLCGAVRYEFNVPAGEATACHCSQCRKQTGHFVASIYLDWADVTVTGEESITWYASSDFAKRGFCSKCGSNLFWVSPEYGAGISAGSLDKPSGTKLVRNIFVADKGDYYDLSDGLPQHESYPPDIEQPEA